MKGDAAPEFYSNNLRNNKEGGLQAPDGSVAAYMDSNHVFNNNTSASEDQCAIM